MKFNPSSIVIAPGVLGDKVTVVRSSQAPVVSLVAAVPGAVATVPMPVAAAPPAPVVTAVTIANASIARMGGLADAMKRDAAARSMHGHGAKR